MDISFNFIDKVTTSRVDYFAINLACLDILKGSAQGISIWISVNET